MGPMKEGTCQACFRSHVCVEKGAAFEMVLHGYKRPGDGFLIGDCSGVGELPYELSCEHTKCLAARIESDLVVMRERLVELEADKVEWLFITVEVPRAERKDRFRPEYRSVSIDRTYVDPTGAGRSFEWHRGFAVTCKERDIRHAMSTLAFFNEMIAKWELAPERLLDHEAAERERARLTAEERLAKDGTARWVRLWKNIGTAMRTHREWTKNLAEYSSRPWPHNEEMRLKRIADFKAKLAPIGPYVRVVPKKAKRKAS